MKKIIYSLLMLVLLLTLVGCGGDAHEHSYSEEVVEATCTEGGYTKYTCECGDTYNDNEVQAKGHSYGEWTVVKEATEDEEGSKEKVCSVCNDKVTETIPTLEHTHKYTDKVVEATCTEDGYTEHTCECGDTYKDSEVEAKGHSYGEWVTILEPTVSEEGLKEKTCSSCGEKEKEIIDFLEVENVFRIKFVTNKEKALWPTRAATTHQEIYNELYKDLYEWAKSNGETKSYEDYAAELTARLAKYEDINLRNTTLGNYPAEDGSTKYFLNVPKYFVKWSEFFALFNEAMLKVNSGQNFYVDDYATMVRLNQFLTWSSTGQKYFKSYLSSFCSKTKVAHEVPKTYNLGDQVTLPELSLANGLQFLGWYDNPEFTGNPITEIKSTDSGHKTFYAKWEEETKVEKVEINSIHELFLFKTHQLVWSVTPDDATEKEIEFFTSDPSIITVSSKGLITAVSKGVATITVKVYGNRDLDFTFDVLVYTDDDIDGTYASTSYVEVGNEITLLAEVVRKDQTKEKVNWTSLTPEFATVNSEGVVTAVAEGVAKIVASDPKNENLKLEFVVVVFDEMPTGILDLALKANESNVFTKYNLGIGSGVPVYYSDVLGSVSKLLGNSTLEKDTSYYNKANKTTATYGTMASIEFITVHYTGNMSKGADASANANYFSGSSSVSIHYTTGNDGVYYLLDESKGAWHAGDSASIAQVGEFQWFSTGVKAGANDPLFPEITISDDFYYEINGQKTTVKMPNPWNHKERNTDHILNADGTISSQPDYGQTGFTNRTPESFINDQGLPFKIVDGEYYMGTTWWSYGQVYEGRICGNGGNKNSIGIESCVDIGSDLWWTWQKTAQLVADIMVRQNLDITRIRGHHFFDGKDCPQPMLENDLEIWWEFLALVEAEYELLTKYEGYEVSIKSNNPDIVDDYGRVIKQPDNTTCVTYTITFTKGNDTQSITLASMVKGMYIGR